MPQDTSLATPPEITSIDHPLKRRTLYNYLFRAYKPLLKICENHLTYSNIDRHTLSAPQQAFTSKLRQTHVLPQVFQRHPA